MRDKFDPALYRGCFIAEKVLTEKMVTFCRIRADIVRQVGKRLWNIAGRNERIISRMTCI